MKKWYYFLLIALVVLTAVFFVRRCSSSESLAGSDADNNGLRDDVEKFIDGHYSDEKIRIAAKEFHRSLQEAIVTPEKWDFRKANQASDCLYYLDEELAPKVTDAMEAETANTMGRAHNYWKANAMLSGGIYPGIRPRKEACSFEPVFKVK